MIIHSNFKDYYDSASAFGVDNTCHFIRNPIEVFGLDADKAKHPFAYKKRQDFIDFIAPPKKDRWMNVNQIPLKLINVFFCGWHYKIAHVYYEVERKMYCSEYKSEFVHTNEEFAELNKEHKLFWDVNHRNSAGARNWDSDGKLPDLTPKKVDNQFFFDLGAPYFSIAPDGFGKVFLNIYPVLKDIEFYKFKSPSVAFQEIHSYISGVLGGEHPKMLEVSDTIRLEKHGFCKQMSFRKRKAK